MKFGMMFEGIRYLSCGCIVLKMAQKKKGCALRHSLSVERLIASSCCIAERRSTSIVAGLGKKANSCKTWVNLLMIESLPREPLRNFATALKGEKTTGC